MFVPAAISKERADRAVALLDEGLSDYEVARRTGVSRSSVQRWRTQGQSQAVAPQAPPCWCPPEPTSYAYLLGIYLGDGYLLNGHAPSPTLEVSLDPSYPRIVDECAVAIERVAGAPPRTSRRKTSNGGAIRLVATSAVWPLAFPQHGPGKKHERPIRLKPWQKAVVDQFPGQLLRGLIHSDGARVVNRFTVHLATGPREYRYTRYFFTNLSTDIRGVFCDACDCTGIRWTQSSPKNISIAERRSVALLDAFVGPKQ